MRITKLEHAALVLQEGGRRLVVDPGSLTNPILGLTKVDAVVITHEHADHWSADQLHRLQDANPGLTIHGPAGVAEAAEGFDVQVVAPGDTITVGRWSLRFFGGNHAVIHPTIPIIDNVGVLVDDRLYYPGDSFYVPVGVAVDTLATPIGAPWLKVGEVMDFAAQVSPRRAFGVHDGTLSAAGKQVVNDRLKAVVEGRGGEWHVLQPDDALDV